MSFCYRWGNRPRQVTWDAQVLRSESIHSGSMCADPVFFVHAISTEHLKTAKNLSAVRETWVQSLSWEDPLEKGMATHSTILAWRLDPMDCSLPGSSVHGILQARILEWVAISFARGSSQPWDQTRVSRIVGRCITVWAKIEPSRLQSMGSQSRTWLSKLYHHL